jgi:phenol 2-monooxygenase
MELGQADGVQCRTVEVFESLGLEGELLRRAYHVLEVAFWSADREGKLVRTGRTADTMPGLSHQPHVILNQAVVNGFLLDDMKKNGLSVEYDHAVKGVSVDNTAADVIAEVCYAHTDVMRDRTYPVTIMAETRGAERIFKAKYALVRLSESS